MTDAPEKKYWPYWTCPKCGAGLHGVITQADVQGRVLGFSVLTCDECDEDYVEIIDWQWRD